MKVAKEFKDLGNRKMIVKVVGFQPLTEPLHNVISAENEAHFSSKFQELWIRDRTDGHQKQPR